jgi:hypothetical protein
LPVGIYRDDEHSAKFFCTAQIPDVPGVKEVKTSVRQNNTLARPADRGGLLDKRFAIDYRCE